MRIEEGCSWKWIISNFWFCILNNFTISEKFVALEECSTCTQIEEGSTMPYSDNRCPQCGKDVTHLLWSWNGNKYKSYKCDYLSIFGGEDVFNKENQFLDIYKLCRSWIPPVGLDNRELVFQSRIILGACNQLWSLQISDELSKLWRVFQFSFITEVFQVYEHNL